MNDLEQKKLVRLDRRISKLEKKVKELLMKLDQQWLKK